LFFRGPSREKGEERRKKEKRSESRERGRVAAGERRKKNENLQRRFSLPLFPLPPSLLSLSLRSLSFLFVLTASTSGFFLEMPPPVGYVSTPDNSRATPDATALSEAAAVESTALPPGSEASSSATGA